MLCFLVQSVGLRACSHLASQFIDCHSKLCTYFIVFGLGFGLLVAVPDQFLYFLSDLLVLAIVSNSFH